MHGGDIYNNKIEHDFSVNLNPFIDKSVINNAFIKSVDRLSCYPEYDSVRLCSELGCKLNLDSSFITVTNGASEAILSIVRALNPKKAVIFSPSFSGYERALFSVNVSGIEYVPHGLILSDGISLNSDELLCEYKESLQNAEDAYGHKAADNTVFFLASPSNPSGIITTPEEIAEIYKIIKSQNGYLVLDECFIELSDGYSRSMLSCIKNNPEYYDRMIILRSFTKTYAVAGIRLGYCVCTSKIINEKIRMNLPEWNISSMASDVGIACLKTDISNDIEKIRMERNYLISELKKLNVITFKSDTVYILFKSEKDLHKRMLDKKILIRDCSDYHYLGKGYFRIAVKTHEENEILINALREVLMQDHK